MKLSIFQLCISASPSTLNKVVVKCFVHLNVNCYHLEEIIFLFASMNSTHEILWRFIRLSFHNKSFKVGVYSLVIYIGQSECYSRAAYQTEQLSGVWCHNGLHLDRKGLCRQLQVAVNNHSHCIYKLTTVNSNTLWCGALSLSEVLGLNHTEQTGPKHLLCVKHCTHRPKRILRQTTIPKEFEPKESHKKELTRKFMATVLNKMKKRWDQGWNLCIIYIAGIFGTGMDKKWEGKQWSGHAEIF